MLMFKIPREIGLSLFGIVERLRTVISRKLQNFSGPGVRIG